MLLVKECRHVVVGIPVLLAGGTEMQTLNLVNVLVDAGYGVTVCCYYEYYQGIVDRFKDAGANVILMKYERARGLWHLAKGLFGLFKALKPDFVHVQYVAPGLIPIIAARLAGIHRIFATVHIAGSVAYGKKAKVLLGVASRFCTTFFCVSKGVEEFWFGNSRIFDPYSVDPNRRHYTIYNAVDVENISSIGKETDKGRLRASMGLYDNKILGIVGRLAPQKGHSVLLKALTSVLCDFPDVILLVIGKGAEEPSLRKLAKELGVSDHVLWLGEKKHEEVFQFYSIMDIFVMPSLYEGFGLTAAEAMAAGVPVVATRVDGLSEVVQDGISGYLVESGDANDLAQALINLLSNSEAAAKMGKAGYLRVTEKFSFKKFRDSLTGAYQEFGAPLPMSTEP